MKKFIADGYWLAFISVLGFILITVLGAMRLDIPDSIIAVTCLTGISYIVLAIVKICTRS